MTTDATVGSTRSPVRGSRRLLGWFVSAYVQLFIGGLLDAAGELLLKVGANAPVASTGVLHFVAATFRLPPLGSGWTWLGIAAYVGGLLCWLYVLRTIPLSIAFPVISFLHVLVPIGAAVVLHEHVNGRRWLGISLALLGVLMILRPVIKAEEQL
jgi:drug/metabolite transporter (DMT)-like permease